LQRLPHDLGLGLRGQHHVHQIGFQALHQGHGVLARGGDAVFGRQAGGARCVQIAQRHRLGPGGTPAGKVLAGKPAGTDHEHTPRHRRGLTHAGARRA
jgi:hypothetical protein